MRSAALLVALFAIVVGIVGLVSPDTLLTFRREYLATSVGLYLGGAVRMAMGVVLILFAPALVRPRLWPRGAEPIRPLLLTSEADPTVERPLMLLPASVVAVEGFRLVSPDALIFREPLPATLADAITRRYGVEHVYAFIDAGQDPNAPVRVQDPDYTGGGAVTVPPLIAAIAARDSTVAQMLLDYGTRLELEQHRPALCFARAWEMRRARR